MHIRVRLTNVNRREWIGAVLFTAGLLFAFLAQGSIYDTGKWMGGALVYACAFALLIAGWSGENQKQALAVDEPLREIHVPAPAHPARKLYVLPSLLFAFIAYSTLRDNTFTPLGTGAWISALVLFFVAFWQGSPRGMVERVRRISFRKSGPVLLALVGIVLLGVFFYFYRLDEIPAEMTSDHAEKILDTHDILNGTYSIFFERNTGREPLQFYLNALVVALKIAPLDMIALKIVGACAGVLTIPAVFLLGRELFDRQVGLLAAFLFAVSILPLAIARIGLRYPLSPLFVAWTCYFLLRALKRQSRNDFLMAGLMLGIGLNGYSPFRVVVLLVMVWMGVWLIFNLNASGRELTRFAANVAMMFGAALLVFVPLLRYLSENPGLFAYRMATRLTSLEQAVPADPLGTFLDNTWRALGMFNVRGDVVWVNALPDVPVVDWVIGACFLIGAAYGAYRLARYRECRFALIAAAFLILLLPSTLAIAFPEENPSVVRAGGVAPFVMILAALPLAAWRRQFSVLRSSTLGDVLLGLVLLAAVLVNYQLYFVRYADQYRKAAWNSTEIAEALREFAVESNDWEHIYIVSAPHWVDHRAVGIHLGNYDFNSHLVENKETLERQKQDPAAKMYALKNQDTETLQYLLELYPNGLAQRMESQTPGRSFIAFYAPARE